MSSVSVVIPTYRRERLLVETVEALVDQLREGDELIVVDQTGTHEPATAAALQSLAERGRIRWIRKSTPNQAEAMNVGALLAGGEILLFFDDDIVPRPGLVEAHRAVLAAPDGPPATCGQVLQPWNETPVTHVRDFALGFDTAFDREADILTLIAANFGVRKSVYLAVGGMDENYRGYNYRNDTEIAFRIFRHAGRKVRFVPAASVRHLLAMGGNRAFGQKDSWGNIGSSIGDYYFAFRSLGIFPAAAHCARRLFRAPLNRYTVRRPWLVPSLFVRELVALVRAAMRVLTKPRNYIKPLEAYRDVAE